MRHREDAIYSPGPFARFSEPSARDLTIEGALWLEDYTPKWTPNREQNKAGTNLFEGVPVHHYGQQFACILYARANGGLDQKVAFRVHWYWFEDSIFIMDPDKGWREVEDGNGLSK